MLYFLNLYAVYNSTYNLTRTEIRRKNSKSTTGSIRPLLRIKPWSRLTNNCPC